MIVVVAQRRQLNKSRARQGTEAQPEKVIVNVVKAKEKRLIHLKFILSILPTLAPCPVCPYMGEGSLADDLDSLLDVEPLLQACHGKQTIFLSNHFPESMMWLWVCVCVSVAVSARAIPDRASQFISCLDEEGQS